MHKNSNANAIAMSYFPILSRRRNFLKFHARMVAMRQRILMVMNAVRALIIPHTSDPNSKGSQMVCNFVVIQATLNSNCIVDGGILKINAPIL